MQIEIGRSFYARSLREYENRHGPTRMVYFSPFRPKERMPFTVLPPFAAYAVGRGII